MSRNILLWCIWFFGTLIIGGFLFASMLYGGNRSMFLIGKTTSGHHQIELSCDTCHTQGFSDADSIQDACLNCHKNDLKLANDSHPIKKFRDPRNADRLAKLDASKCVTCHTEHRPGVTRVMGVTLPDDYCFKCHENIAEERPHTHKNLGFETCASAGCHNYHDNKALYERFLEKHAEEPVHKDTQIIKLIDAEPLPESLGGLKRGDPIEKANADAPKAKLEDVDLVANWHQDAHAQKGVNCSGCHGVKEDKTAWVEKPGREVCASCHKNENKTFLLGKHGMRQQADLYSSKDALWGLFKKTKLSPMKPEMARAKMSAKTHGQELGCNSCHSAHDFNTQKAKVEACLSCHSDDHSQSYTQSAHYELWKKELSGELPKGSGVTCATCHMPRQEIEDEFENEIVVVNHNQNDNLRPNEKMIRSVCSSCHGLQFTLNALADKELIKSNFKGQPSIHIESIEWALKRSRK